jgi:acyl-CoA thioester hydrolase
MRMVHRTLCRVIYGDTDRMGQVYYGNYFRWFEVGRTELFRSVGLPYKEIEERGFFLPVSECRAKYHAPALYDEVLVIETAVDDSVKGGIKFDYRIFREDGKTLLAEGFTRHAFVDRSGRVTRPPGFIRKLVAQNAAAEPPQ